jgi:hypothetical protein
MGVFKLLVRLLLAFVLATLGFSLVSALAAALMRPRLADDAAPGDDELELAAVYTGREFRSVASAFTGGRLICWYSGLDVDLRAARLDLAGGDLEIWTVFGGTRVQVPSDWRIVLRGISIFGGADAETTPFDDLEPGPVLQVRHRTIFGGFTVHADPGEALAVA